MYKCILFVNIVCWFPRILHCNRSELKKNRFIIAYSSNQMLFSALTVVRSFTTNLFIKIVEVCPKSMIYLNSWRPLKSTRGDGGYKKNCMYKYRSSIALKLIYKCFSWIEHDLFIIWGNNILELYWVSFQFFLEWVPWKFFSRNVLKFGKIELSKFKLLRKL